MTLVSVVSVISVMILGGGEGGGPVSVPSTVIILRKSSDTPRNVLEIDVDISDYHRIRFKMLFLFPRTMVF